MITKGDVETAALLARVRLRDDEVERLTRDLERVVGYVEQLQEVDVDGVEPMVQPFDLAAPFEAASRADEPAPVIGRRSLEGSAGYDEGLVRVPKVVE